MGINHVTKPIERFTCNIRHNDSYYNINVQAEYYLIPDDEGYGMIRLTEASYYNAKILTLEPKNLESMGTIQ